MKTIFTENRLRYGISVLLALFVCLGLFCTAICTNVLVASTTKFIGFIIEKSNYANIATEQLTQGLNDLAIPSGLPEDFFDNKIDSNKLGKLFSASTKNLILGNKNYKVSTEEFKNVISSLVTEYSKNEAGDFSSAVEKDIERFSNECSNIYLSYVNPSITSYLFELLATAKKYIWMGLAVSIIFTLLAGLFLFKMNRINDFFKFGFAAFSGAALTVGVIPLYLILTNEIARISISSKSLYAFMTTFAQQFLLIMLLSAGVLLAIAVIFIAVKIFNLIFRN